MKISYKVPLIATTIILIAFAVFSFWQYTTIKESLLGESKQNIDETANLLEDSVSAWLNERVDAMQGMAEILAQDPEVNKEDVYTNVDVFGTEENLKDFTIDNVWVYVDMRNVEVGDDQEGKLYIESSSPLLDIKSSKDSIRFNVIE